MRCLWRLPARLYPRGRLKEVPVFANRLYNLIESLVGQ